MGVHKMINLHNLIKHPEWIKEIKKHDPEKGKTLEEFFKAVEEKSKTKEGDKE